MTAKTGPEIEITPEMIEVGVKVYVESLEEDASRRPHAERAAVRAIYLAMAAKRGTEAA